MSQPVPAPDAFQADVEPCFFAPATENFRWEGVSVTEYKPTPGQEAGFCGILRQTLFGGRNESISFEVRYFEIGPGGWSSLECHEHAHAVIGLRGTGQVLLGDQVRTLGFLDLAYIGSNQPHRLANEGAEPFGFLCIVDARRDTSRLLRPADLPHLLAQAETAHILKKGEF